MRVLVADRLSEDALDEMRGLGVEVDYDPTLEGDALVSRLSGINVLVVRGTPVTAAAIEAGRSLNLVIRAGAGTGSIDVGSASERGIYVADTPGRNASGVAELTFALITSLDRRIPDAVASLRKGHWEKDEFARAAGLQDRTIGLLGLGHVGRAVLKIAQAFGMRPHAFGRTLSTSRATELGVQLVRSPAELARVSEVLSVHLALNDRTRGMVNRKVLEALPDGAIFVNTARHELVDYDALLELIPQKSLRAGLDVLPGEPGERTGRFEHPILRSGVVYATPHIGASTDRAQTEIASETVRILRSFVTSGEVPNVVNISPNTWSRYQLVVRHIDRLGALANVLAVLKRHGIHINELDNTVFDGGRAACAKIRVESRPSEACLQEIMAFSDEVLHVDLVTLPNVA
jgi:D-3-phosphoglycerate dehydrogenase